MSRTRSLARKRNIEYFESFQYQHLYWKEFDYTKLSHIMQRRQAGHGNNSSHNDIIIMADTETSKSIPDTVCVNHICIWTVSLRAYHINIATLWGRTPSELVECLTKIHESMDGERTIIFWHNLSYDYVFLRQFLYKRWKIPDKQLNTKPHYPINIEFGNGIVFRDSLCISQRSLERWAKDLDVEHKKAVGSWDYDLIRNQDYNYSDEEHHYAENDTLAGVECIDAYMEAIGKNITTLPYTATGTVRDQTRKAGKKYNAHSQYLRICIDDLVLLHKATRIYHGGYAHANRYIVGRTIEESITAYDFASSYPFVMLTELYPMEKYTHMDIPCSLEDVIALANDDYSVLMTLKMSYVKPKDIRFPMPVLQQSKAKQIFNPVLDNGRIIKCDYIEIDVSEINLQLILSQYDYEEILIEDVYYAKKDYLPRWFRDFIFEKYKKKCELKGGDKVLYDISKSVVNCLYGMCCQKAIQNDIKEDYDTGEFYIEEKDGQELLDKKNKNFNSILPYQWGIYVTEYAMRNLFELGSCCKRWLYSDTDSCYGQKWNYRKLAEYNVRCKKKMLDAGYGPVTILRDGNTFTYNLGCAELDGIYTQFRTLGSKRYCCRKKSDGELKLTVAGVPKKTGVKCLNNDIENFKEGMDFPGEVTGKRTHTFIYSEEGIYIDDQGNEVADSIDLSPCNYHLDTTLAFEWLFQGESGEFSLECYDGGNIF